MKLFDGLRKDRNKSATSDAEWNVKWEANLEKAMESAINEIPIERRQQLLDECIIRFLLTAYPD